MRNRLLTSIISLAALIAITGCTSRYDRVDSARPGGGIAKVINKPQNIVFPAAVRVMHDNGDEIWEANRNTGKIVSLSTFGIRAIFFMPLSHGRTRVEISPNFSSLIGGYSGGASQFFILLREQIVVYEKKEAYRKFIQKTKKVDSDLRTIFKPESESEKEKAAAPEPAPAPAPPSRFLRFRRRR